MKRFNPERKGRYREPVYLRIEFVHVLDSLLYISALDRIANDIAFVDTVEANRRWHISLLAELIGSRLIALSNEVVHNNSVQVTAWENNRSVRSVAT